jgi:hypothetical protein
MIARKIKEILLLKQKTNSTRHSGRYFSDEILLWIDRTVTTSPCRAMHRSTASVNIAHHEQK